MAPYFKYLHQPKACPTKQHVKFVSMCFVVNSDPKTTFAPSSNTSVSATEKGVIKLISSLRFSEVIHCIWFESLPLCALN